MSKQGSIWLVVSFLLLTAGIVYALSTTSPPGRMAAVKNPKPPTPVQAPKAEEVAFSPDMSQVNPVQFLDPLPVGKPAPDFTGKTADGKTVKLSDYKGKKNVVLVFYQGSFCSVCGAQLSNLQKHLADFRNQDAEIIAISADDPAHAMSTASDHGLNFPVVADHQKEIIRKFGIANVSRQNIAWPSLFIVDKQGQVKLSYADPQGHRLHSNEILPELSKLTGKPAPKLGYDE